ncbi:MAG: ABC transporter ATP-binding protein [Gammaproteobacteria bacterium]|nr:ABC transporter ATP-binding protein [Gammaproteobacteria bacterium]
MTDPGTDRDRQALRVERLGVAFDGRPLLHDITFGVRGGQTLAIVGASGCGKTTLLKAIAGLLPTVGGRIQLGARAIEALPARTRNAVYLYQEPLLFPHLDVFGNVAFGLRLRGLRGADLEQRVMAMLEQLQLAALARRRPQALSGGQRQRVAFGRALIVEPALLLLDEPFSNLDPEARADMQALFRNVAAARGITAIFVTHDVKESLLVGDAFALLREGRLQIYADRQAFCADPASGVGREAGFWREMTNEVPHIPGRS